MTEQIWQCPRCGRTYREYINGCLNHDDEETPSSVELVLEVVPDAEAHRA